MNKELMDQIAASSARNNILPAITHALLRDLSECRQYADLKETSELNDISDYTGIGLVTLGDALRVSNGQCCRFEFSESQWRTYRTVAVSSPELAFLMSCRLGISLRLGSKVALTGTQPVKALREFMEDVSKQIDLLLIEFHNLCQPPQKGERGGLLVGISRLYEPFTDTPTAKGHLILGSAKSLEPRWAEYQKAEHERKSKNPPIFRT